MARLLMSSRHRVLPLQAESPDEDLVSLVYFYEADHETGSRTVLGTGPYKIAAVSDTQIRFDRNYEYNPVWGFLAGQAWLRKP